MKKATKDILHYYILGFILLLGYYIGEGIGLTTWVFAQQQIIILTVLTVYYGTIILIADKVLHQTMGLN